MKDHQVNSIECPLWALVACAANHPAMILMAAFLCALCATLALLGRIIERRKRQSDLEQDETPTGEMSDL